MARQIIKRGDNTWLVRIYLGRGADGKRQYQNHTVHGVKKSAQKWLNNALTKKDVGIPTFQSKVSLGDYLDRWLKDVAKPRVSEQTFRGYSVQLNRVKREIGQTRLTHLRPEDVQSFYSDLSSSTARHAHAPLRSALSQAVKWHMIHANPCDLVDLPRHETAEIQSLTREEAGRLMAVENRYRVVFAFLLTSGARPSEAFGLKWSDIDMERGVVSVQRSLQWHSKKEGGGWFYAEPKTKTSRRTVPLPSSIIGQLKAHRATQAEALLKLGVRTDIMFANSEGTPILRRNLVRRHFKPALLMAGLPGELSLYCLRHTCASLLLQAGVHPKVVAERLGHSSTRLTMDVYSHVAPGMQAEATAQLERMLYG